MKEKLSKKNNLLRFVAVLLILSMCVLITPYSHADDLTDAKENLKDVNNEIEDAKSDLKAGKAEVSALTSEINSLEKKIYSTEVELNELAEDINETKALIADTLDSLNSKQEEMSNQNDALNNRLRSMYKNGDAGMLSVLLGSVSLSEVMTNMDMISRIYESDAKLLASLEEQYSEINGVKSELLELKTQLLEQQAKQEELKVTLAADQEAAEAKRNEVAASNAEIQYQIDALNEEANALTAQIILLQSLDEYAGGTMLWPAQSSRRITSNFGYRIHPITKKNSMHTGIDIGAAKGTNILAANAGKVIKAGWNNSYGYMVMIDHGGGIVTLYAHSSKLLVSTGDIVTRGQVIALVGSTGMSTGPHLHFEVRVDGVYKNPLEYVTP